MGIDVPTLRFLLLARSKGTSFAETITLGRQDLLLETRELTACFNDVGDVLPLGDAEAILNESRRFAEPLLRRLGAGVTDSLDRSAFEGASVLHDLNEPLPSHLASRYSLVIDGGTLEHVFHFPTALRNCMEMVRVGGHLVIVSPTNNFMGHGFYQLSPELFHRAFSPDNGFRVELMLMTRQFEDAVWYRVRDPVEVGRRVGHNADRWPLALYVLATRVRETPIFSVPPQQSDYANQWRIRAEKHADPNRLAFYAASRNGPLGQARSAVRKMMPPRALDLLRSLRGVLRDTAPPDPQIFQSFDVRVGPR